MGVMAKVVADGMIAVGDPVKLLQNTPHWAG
jgi:MOSC domain-containing protein YiiM